MQKKLEPSEINFPQYGVHVHRNLPLVDRASVLIAWMWINALIKGVSLYQGRLGEGGEGLLPSIHFKMAHQCRTCGPQNLTLLIFFLLYCIFNHDFTITNLIISNGTSLRCVFFVCEGSRCVHAISCSCGMLQSCKLCNQTLSTVKLLRTIINF